MSLNPKQAKFVEEYLKDLNATQAATRAGYSPRSAEVTGCRLLGNAKVAEAVQKAMAARSKRTEITADRVLSELAKIGFADVRRIFTPGGSLLSPVDMDEEIAAAVQSVEVVERPKRNADGEVEIEHVRKVRLNDKLGALTQIGRHLGMFTDKTEHSGAVQHDHGFVDKPPPETREEWLERRSRELSRDVGSAAGSSD